LAVRRDAFNAVGGFDASLEACEDVDLCRRLRAAGWRIVADEDLRSVHYGDPRTLRALFRAERWRGRDNVRVTLRSGLSARDLPSLFIPIVDLAALAVAIVAGLAWPFVGPSAATIATVAVVTVAIFAVLRASRIVTRIDRRTPLALLRACLVALTYDVARALALVTRASHHRSGAQGRVASSRVDL
jgi:hypothetical protein